MKRINLDDTAPKANDTIAERSVYGTRETMGLANGAEYHAQFNRNNMVDWTAPGLKVTRLRLLSDPGYPMWDVSYCHGEMPDGTKVHVQLPFSELPKSGLSRAIVEAAIKDGVHAKRMGILSAISTLN